MGDFLLFGGRMNKDRNKTRRLVLIGVMSALAFAFTCIGNLIPIKVAGFLDYDPKDIIIVIAGFISGPISALAITLVTATIEAVTISQTGPIGFAMNIISTSFFVVPSIMIYQKKRTLFGAILGLLVGVLSMCGAMMIWNYLITPLYMAGVTREAVAKMLPTVFLPFNFIKGCANASLSMLLYKPLVNALRRAKMLDAVENPNKRSERKILLVLVSVAVFIACALGFLIMGGVI
jgi:riboflavin transporter FmnP